MALGVTNEETPATRGSRTGATPSLPSATRPASPLLLLALVGWGPHSGDAVWTLPGNSGHLWVRQLKCWEAWRPRAPPVHRAWPAAPQQAGHGEHQAALRTGKAVPGPTRARCPQDRVTADPITRGLSSPLALPRVRRGTLLRLAPSWAPGSGRETEGNKPSTQPSFGTRSKTRPCQDTEQHCPRRLLCPWGVGGGLGHCPRPVHCPGFTTP